MWMGRGGGERGARAEEGSEEKERKKSCVYLPPSSSRMRTITLSLSLIDARHSIIFLWGRNPLACMRARARGRAPSRPRLTSSLLLSREKEGGSEREGERGKKGARAGGRENEREIECV